jgi:small subunit ribosomal protein S21
MSHKVYYENKKQYKKEEEEHFTKGNGEVLLEECGGDLEKAIRKLKRKLKNDGIFEKLKEKEFFEKPSDRKRRKKSISKYNCRKSNNTEL